MEIMSDAKKSSGYSQWLGIFFAVIVVVLKLTRTLHMIFNIYSGLLLITVYVIHELFYKRRRLPPGPTPWLVAGNMPSFVLGSSIDDLFQSWKKQYGGVFTVWIGPIPLVMVSDLASIKKYFIQNADVFSNRWRNHVTDTFMGGANGVVQIDGPKWREQRRFSLHVLRDFGVGRAQMESKIMEEVNAFSAFLQENQGQVTINSAIAVCVGNVINNMLFGVRFPQGSHEMHHLHSLLDQQSRLVVNPIMGLYIAAPWTTDVPLLNSKWMELMGIREHLWNFLQKQINEHHEKSATDDVIEDDFTFTYMREMERRRQAGEDMGYFDDWQMKMLLLDLFFAGMETTVTTLKWGFLLAILHPKVQRRVQEELDNECSGSTVTLSDRPRLPYTQATINEIQRVANILPINLLRTVSEDVTIDDYHFPQGTLVIPQISILMNDERAFPEPKTFRPERFLTEDGKLRRIDEFLPFSVGKRQCLGESLAKAELFLIFSNLLKRFDFRPPTTENGISGLSTQRLLGLTVSPPKYDSFVQLRKRDENHNLV
ncbi:Unspecific monooxygenase [Trichostrongylus colubriformis]|uniref:Unspecific monooxygenase n=1 Tax=Trichostrongylus colubriformis TaxID=6319 RepID=A0AAN8F8H5_TRICO